MATIKSKKNNIKNDEKKEVKKSTSRNNNSKNKKQKATIKDNNNKKRTTKRKSYADEMKVDMSLQTKTTLLTIFTVILVLVTFYVITIYATGGSIFKFGNKNSDIEFQYSEILLGRSFDMGGNYFVIYYDKTDTENEQTTELNNLSNTFKNNSSGAAIYTCDLGNVFNKPFTTTEEPNTNPYGAEDMLINGPTLIRFADGKVMEYIYGYDDVVNYINGYNPE